MQIALNLILIAINTLICADTSSCIKAKLAYKRKSSWNWNSLPTQCAVDVCNIVRGHQKEFLDIDTLPTNQWQLVDKNAKPFRLIFFLMLSVIHIDIQSTYLYSILNVLVDTFTNVHLLRKQRHTSWGSRETLNAFVDALYFVRHLSWTYIINLSESDYPVKSIDHLSRILDAYDPTNFIRFSKCDQLSKKRQGLDRIFTQCGRRMIDTGASRNHMNKLQFGSDWLHYINHNLRFVAWNRSFSCQKGKHSCTGRLSSDDQCGCSALPLSYPFHLTYLLKPSTFFARKIDATFSPDLLNVIDGRLAKRTKYERGQRYKSESLLHWLNRFHSETDKSSSISMAISKLIQTLYRSPNCSYQLHDATDFYNNGTYEGIIATIILCDMTVVDIFLRSKSISKSTGIYAGRMWDWSQNRFKDQSHIFLYNSHLPMFITVCNRSAIEITSDHEFYQFKQKGNILDDKHLFELTDDDSVNRNTNSIRIHCKTNNASLSVLILNCDDNNVTRINLDKSKINKHFGIQGICMRNQNCSRTEWSLENRILHRHTSKIW
ncbi:hypothetical protein GJ496_002788 [Pomphorhynchus laevis]|nr:hypothetical protein GJ496_002788 [Pomphorhynchus laevis]